MMDRTGHRHEAKAISQRIARDIVDEFDRYSSEHADGETVIFEDGERVATARWRPRRLDLVRPAQDHADLVQKLRLFGWE